MLPIIPVCTTSAFSAFFSTCPASTHAAMAGRKKARTLDFPVPAPALLNSGAAGAFLRPGPSATLTGKCLCTAHDADGFYRILGILPCATSEEVATAHRARRLRLHLGSCKDDAKETLGNLSTLLDQARPAQPLFAHARTQSTYTGKHATVHQAHARTTAQHTHARRTAYPTHTHTHTTCLEEGLHRRHKCSFFEAQAGPQHCTHTCAQ
jgi:hypothetical protein